MKILLHACCGPCASAALPVLAGKGDEVAMFYSNSNIDTEEEFERRLESARRLAAADGVEIVADVYDHADWLEKVAKGFENEPEKGARCRRCWEYSLRRTAEYAASRGFDAFSTSLTTSPHKPSPAVFEAGEKAGAGRFLAVDFKKSGGFLVSTRRSAELALYRQKYCGCEFSRRARAAAATEDEDK